MTRGDVPEVVAAKRFELVADDGRAALSIRTRDGLPAIEMADEDGKPRIRISVSDRKGPRIELFDADGEAVAYLNADGLGGTSTLSLSGGADGRGRVKAGIDLLGKPFLSLRDNGENVKAEIAVDGDGNPFLSAYSRGGEKRLSISVQDGGCTFDLFDSSNAHPRLSLGVYEGDAPAVCLLGRDGVPVFGFALQDQDGDEPYFSVLLNTRDGFARHRLRAERDGRILLEAFRDDGTASWILEGARLRFRPARPPADDAPLLPGFPDPR